MQCDECASCPCTILHFCQHAEDHSKEPRRIDYSHLPARLADTPHEASAAPVCRDVQTSASAGVLVSGKESLHTSNLTVCTLTVRSSYRAKSFVTWGTNRNLRAPALQPPLSWQKSQSRAWRLHLKLVARAPLIPPYTLSRQDCELTCCVKRHIASNK